MANVMVRRANVILEIPEDETVISKYLSNGFDIVDESGKIIKKSTHGRSESELRRELEALQEKYDKLLADYNELKTRKSAPVIKSAVVEDIAEEPEEAPKLKKRPIKSKVKA